MTSVTLAILVNRDMSRLERAVGSFHEQHPHGLHVDPLVVVNTHDPIFRQAAIGLCRRERLPWIATESDGMSGCGKNTCLRWFRGGDTDYLCQLDGDDFLYPTWGQAVEDALRRAPALDVLSLIPIDCIGSGEGAALTLPDGADAGVWGTSTSPAFDGGGPGEDPSLWSDSPVTPAMIRLVSQRAARAAWYDAGPVYSDYLVLLRYLAAHQRGDLQAWLSMSSDWMVVDRLAPGSCQKTYTPDHVLLHAIAEGIVPRERSWVRELPVMYPHMIQSVEEKHAWIERWHIATDGT